jgi:hypothetical protein
MCLIDCCEAIAHEAAQMERKRTEPIECAVCAPDQPCWLHQKHFDQKDAP